MKIKAMIALTAIFSASSLVCKADPFGVASAYNLVALGSGTLAGTINDSADIQGRIAAASTISGNMTLASGLQSDPYGADATVGGVTYDFVAGGGYTSGSTNINGSQGSAYSTSGSGSFNFNGGGHLVSSGNSPIDFNALRTQLDAETAFLGALGTTGTNAGTNYPGAGNPSWFVLVGTNTQLNVFNVTAAELASTNNPLDIIVPAGSTVLINVLDSGSVTFGSTLMLNGQQAFNSESTSKILLNLPNASSLTANAELTASVLAPYAVVSGGADFDGNIIAAQIGQTSEVHNIEFDGYLPPNTPAVPEPGTLALVGSGVLSVAGAVRRRKKGVSVS